VVVGVGAVVVESRTLVVVTAGAPVVATGMLPAPAFVVPGRLVTVPALELDVLVPVPVTVEGGSS